jgi:hypothetical protein
MKNKHASHKGLIELLLTADLELLMLLCTAGLHFDNGLAELEIVLPVLRTRPTGYFISKMVGSRQEVVSDEIQLAKNPTLRFFA